MRRAVIGLTNTRCCVGVTIPMNENPIKAVYVVLAREALEIIEKGGDL
jgi:hypothetical protein